jgi:hypothetical protein
VRSSQGPRLLHRQVRASHRFLNVLDSRVRAREQQGPSDRPTTKVGRPCRPVARSRCRHRGRHSRSPPRPRAWTCAKPLLRAPVSWVRAASRVPSEPRKAPSSFAVYGLTSRITSTPCLGSMVSISRPKHVVPPRGSSADLREPARDLLRLIEGGFLVRSWASGLVEPYLAVNSGEPNRACDIWGQSCSTSRRKPASSWRRSRRRCRSKSNCAIRNVRRERQFRTNGGHFPTASASQPLIR